MDCGLSRTSSRRSSAVLHSHVTCQPSLGLGLGIIIAFRAARLSIRARVMNVFKAACAPGVRLEPPFSPEQNHRLRILSVATSGRNFEKENGCI